MKAEERAKQVWDSLEGPLLAEGDAIEATAKAIREAEQQARKEALADAAMAVHRQRANDEQATCAHAYNYALDDCEQAICALIEREDK